MQMVRQRHWTVRSRVVRGRGAKRRHPADRPCLCVYEHLHVWGVCSARHSSGLPPGTTAWVLSLHYVPSVRSNMVPAGLQ